MIWWLRKTNETTHFKLKTWGELSQENNSLYQIEIYSQDYQFIVNLTQLPNWALNSSDFFDLDLLSHEPQVHALFFSRAWKILNSSFCSVYVLESWLVSTWAMSETLQRH